MSTETPDPDENKESLNSNPDEGSTDRTENVAPTAPPPSSLPSRALELVVNAVLFVFGIIVRYIFGILIEPGDDFVMKVRKLAMGTYFGGLSLPITCWPLWIPALVLHYTSSSSPSSSVSTPWGLIGAILSGTIYFTFVVIAITYAKCFRTCPLWLLDLQACCCGFVVIGLEASLFSYPAETVLGGAAILHIFALSPRGKLIAGMLALISAVHTYNVCFSGQFQTNQGYFYLDNRSTSTNSTTNTSSLASSRNLSSTAGSSLTNVSFVLSRRRVPSDGDSSFFILRFPETFEGQPYHTLYELSIGFMVAILVWVAAAVLVVQYKDATERTQRAIELAKEVTEKLLKYDTDGVRDLVGEFEREVKQIGESTRPEVGTVDDDGGDSDSASSSVPVDDQTNDADQLAESFLNMAENLDRYRPHLPNWLLATVSQRQFAKNKVASEEEEEEEDDEEGTGMMMLTSCSAAADGGVSATSNESGRAVSGDEKDATQLGANSSRSASSDGGSARPAESAAQTHSAGPRRVIPDRVCLVLLEYDVDLLESALVIAHADTKKKKKASSSSGAGTSATGTLERFNSFVERVYELVNEHGGAVHSFVLQRITVSFNGVSRVEDPEMRAVRFVDALFREYPSLTSHDEATGALLQSALSVAVSSGRVEDCGVVSTNNDENRSFVLSLDDDSDANWFADLERLLSSAQQSTDGCICVTEPVALAGSGQNPEVTFSRSSIQSGQKRAAASQAHFWVMRTSRLQSPTTLVYTNKNIE